MVRKVLKKIKEAAKKITKLDRDLDQKELMPNQEPIPKKGGFYEILG
jgi:hypothetical protein